MIYLVVFGIIFLSVSWLIWLCISTFMKYCIKQYLKSSTIYKEQVLDEYRNQQRGE